VHVNTHAHTDAHTDTHTHVHAHTHPHTHTTHTYTQRGEGRASRCKVHTPCKEKQPHIKLAWPLSAHPQLEPHAWVFNLCHTHTHTHTNTHTHAHTHTHTHSAHIHVFQQRNSFALCSAIGELSCAVVYVELTHSY